MDSRLLFIITLFLSLFSFILSSVFPSTKPLFWFSTLTPVVNYHLLKMFSPGTKSRNMPSHLQYITFSVYTEKYNGDKGNSNITITWSVHVYVYMRPRIQITFTWQECIQLIKAGGNYEKFTKFQKSYNLWVCFEAFFPNIG